MTKICSLSKIEHVSCKPTKEDGFSLLETCLVLIILGLILTPLYGFMQEQQKVELQNTEEKVNDRVIAAIAAFFRENGVLPCPADPTLGVGNANFGRSSCGGANIDTVGGVYIGALPTYDLNLPYETAVNTQGWKYRYAVTIDLTAPLTYDSVGSIQILDPAGNAYTDMAPFVIVNPGIDGMGARNLLGGLSTVACAGAGGNVENCDNDASFQEGLFSLNGTPDSATYYDDKIAYTFTRGESSMWLVGRNAGDTAQRIDVFARNDGNIGIGTFAGATNPTAKMDIETGNVRVRNNGANGGNVNSRNVRVTGNVTADTQVDASNIARSPRFIYN